VNDQEREALRAAASVVESSLDYTITISGSEAGTEAYSMLIASPHRVMTLLDEVERLREKERALDWLLSNYFVRDPDMGGNHRWLTRGRFIGRGPTPLAALLDAMKEGK